MKSIEILKQRFKLLIIIGILSFLAGAIFAYIIAHATSSNLSMQVITGGFAGLFIGILITICESFLFEYLSKILNFISLLLVKVFTYVIIITSVLILNSLYSGIGNSSSIIDIINEPSFLTSLQFSSVLTFIFIFILMISSLLGRGVLLNFILGQYHKPKEVNKIFMFIDLKSSTTIAEKIGHKKFMSFVNDFFYDLTSGVLATKGDIYKYVGDEAILVWDYKKGIKKSNCLECFYKIKKSTQNRNRYYLKKYGYLPEFKAGLHGGMVIAGEMGSLKREISFMGDVLNTTSRIEGMCNELDSNFLISQEIYNSLSLKHQFNITEFKDLSLRGKEKKVNLYGVSR